MSLNQDQLKDIKILGVPQKAPKYEHIYVIRERAQVGKFYKMECPECGFNLVKKFTNVGQQKWICPQCKAIVGLVSVAEQGMGQPSDKVVTEKTKPASKSSLQNLGEIVWGGFLAKHRFGLKVGRIYIGRKDKDKPSDIQLNDEYVSRQSVTLEVIPSDKGYLFKLTVIRATNPVCVNGVEIAENNSIYLNYDDVIVLGKSKLIFKKTK